MISATEERRETSSTGVSEAERAEMEALGYVRPTGGPGPRPEHPAERPPIARRAVSAPSVLNEAHAYDRPSSFSRALTFDIGDTTMMLISGTASVDDRGETVHVGDFRAQLWRTFRNITELLRAEGMTWHDIVRTTCYIRDIERDYDDFNEVRTAFYDWLGLDPLPASTAIQARICRSDLLVEIEAIAVRPSR
ncbi:MAG: Rid family hydrolase [Longimicrobiales bacterium]|nr:Rid family hydrolase [Longimicrobiales bacterium]